jgi:hypothetical protein
VGGSFATGPLAAPAGRDKDARRGLVGVEARPLRLGQTRLVQTAIFAPKRVLGLLYWYALYPFHALLFSGLIQHIVRRAEAIAESAAYGGKRSHRWLI